MKGLKTKDFIRASMGCMRKSSMKSWGVDSSAPLSTSFFMVILRCSPAGNSGNHCPFLSVAIWQLDFR